MDRVRKQAIAIAEAEELGVKVLNGILVVELAALLHDVKDYKYSGSDTAGIEAAASFLKAHAVPPAIIARILHVIESPFQLDTHLATIPSHSRRCHNLGRPPSRRSTRLSSRPRT